MARNENILAEYLDDHLMNQRILQERALAAKEQKNDGGVRMPGGGKVYGGQKFSRFSNAAKGRGAPGGTHRAVAGTNVSQIERLAMAAAKGGNPAFLDELTRRKFEDLAIGSAKDLNRLGRLEMSLLGGNQKGFLHRPKQPAAAPMPQEPRRAPRLERDDPRRLRRRGREDSAGRRHERELAGEKEILQLKAQLRAESDRERRKAMNDLLSQFKKKKKRSGFTEQFVNVGGRPERRRVRSQEVTDDNSAIIAALQRLM